MLASGVARLGGRSSLGVVSMGARRARQRGTTTDVARWLTTIVRRQQEQEREAATWGPPPAGTKVFACMSGGVDSSVAARLLLEQGYDVEPVFMRNWDTLDEQSESGGCEWERDWEDVRTVCRENLGGLKPRLVDLSREYWSHVFEPALEGWAAGVTPNPDVTCNQHIKFRVLPERLLAKDPSAWIATGHWARLGPSPLDPSQPALFRSANIGKDQSHYLSTSPISALRRTLFPLGAYSSKDDVRDLAREWGMHTGEKKDSMGICFVGVRKGFSGFLDSYLPPSPGNILDANGKVVGRHNGLWRYTVGERARIGGQSEAMFIANKDAKSNTITIVPKSHPMLRCVSLLSNNFRWISSSHPPHEVDSPQGFECKAQTRSLPFGALAKCTVRRWGKGSLDIDLHEPLVGVSPGQTVALYKGDWCLGGGTIQSTLTLADRPEGEVAEAVEDRPQLSRAVAK
ncbi:hypothetical protein NBRC10513v2_001718 [Rhodotorula toruloides]|uniref:tRNA-5-taurinomethyluridine 2-sulfurtransferase n=1 Tax=Rhodotorula toruloides TaxID=5286 RepID=A0A0K3CHQ4_RHOTO|nr:tRNA methyl transferase-domain containing protein [Rhodotorula toruloides]